MTVKTEFSGGAKAKTYTETDYSQQNIEVGDLQTLAPTSVIIRRYLDLIVGTEGAIKRTSNKVHQINLPHNKGTSILTSTRGPL
jgi:hypothetical protein